MISFSSQMNMDASDTSKEIADAQIAILSAKTTTERLSLVLSLSDTVIGLSRRAIKRASANISDEEVRCRFVELHYGQSLGDSFRRYLENASND